MGQSKEIRQNLTGLRKFNICFCVIFSSYGRSLIPERENGHWILPPTNFQFFLILLVS